MSPTNSTSTAVDTTATSAPHNSKFTDGNELLTSIPLGSAVMSDDGIIDIYKEDGLVDGPTDDVTSIVPPTSDNPTTPATVSNMPRSTSSCTVS